MIDRESVEFLYRQVSPKYRDKIRSYLNLIFTAPIHEHYCCTTYEDIKLCHIDPSTCWAKNNMFGVSDDTCRKFCNQTHIHKWLTESKFAQVSQELNFACCLMKFEEERHIVYRLFDEKYGMIQWDVKIDNIDMWEQLVPTAKLIGMYYEMPMLLSTENNNKKQRRKVKPKMTWRDRKMEIVK